LYKAQITKELKKIKNFEV